MLILVVNICPPVLWQNLRAKEHSSGPKLSKGDEYIGHFFSKGDNNLSAVSCFFFKLMTKQLA